ncbi:MAG TPA: site-2 protease family protein [Jatrophihabitans sp.]|nr:site-2 protease family protein [Jatrophihabitans sp.]
MTTRTAGPGQAGPPAPPDRNPLGRGFPLGRFRGVTLAAHWSVLITVALIAVLLATGSLPQAAPGYPRPVYWLAAVAVSIAFLASLAAHELAHAVLARHYGLPVRRITFWLLGGFTELTEEARTARAEALIAGVGPAVSLLLGLLGGALALLAAVAGGPALLVAALGWLAGTNLLLGLFNLLPGAPLDGGRLLSAVLWWRSGNRATATRTAGSVGSVLGLVLAGLGFLELLAGYYTGLWLVLVGMFLRANAGAQAGLVAPADLAGLRADQAMRPVTVLAPSWWTVAEFVERSSPGGFVQAVLPLVDPDGSPTGLIGWAQLGRVPAGARASTRLSELDRRRQPPLVVPADALVADLAEQLASRPMPAVVVAGGRIVGLLGQPELRRIAELRRLGWQPAAPPPAPPIPEPARHW